MKIAVTGASGFIGRHVLHELIKKGMNVTALTRNAAHLKNVSKDIRILELDISQPPEDSFNRMGSPEILIHLGWDGLPNYKSEHHFETELPRQYSFLKKMIKSGVSSLLVAGTCFEYGMQSGPLTEKMSLKPTNPYGNAKATLYKQLELLKETSPFNLVWARLFYMYGNGQAINSLYPMLKEAISCGKEVFNMSGGEQLRDYLPVEDVARLIVSLAVAKQDLGAINICSGAPISVRGQVEKWMKDNNWKIKLNLGYYPYPDYEPMAFWGERTKLDEFLRQA